MPTKPVATQRDLALAYSPGVAEPCRRIAEHPDAVFRYTARGNLVAVVSNGTAVPGPGNLGPLGAKPIRGATRLVRERAPDLVVDGERQADTARQADILAGFPFSALRRPANVLIFPDLDSANISYKLLWRLGGVAAIGPILLGMARPVHVLQRGSQAAEIVNLAAIAVVDTQERARADG